MPDTAPPPPSAICDFRRVRAPGGRGVYASSGHLFRDAVFGRDSLEVAEDVLYDDPGVAHEVILALARLQGTTETPAGPGCSEEQPGRIHHESRERVIDGRVVDADVAEIILLLSAKWGGDAERMTYYGSVDATPLFVRLIDRYCTRMESTALLDETFVNKDGVRTTVRESALAAARWVARNVEASQQTSGLGLLEYQRRNPFGLEYQGWRDGRLSLVHPARRPLQSRASLPVPRPPDQCGEVVNPDAPIATVETQGLAFDALQAAARIAPGSVEASSFAALAEALRTNVFKHFWMPRERYFATAIDRDAAGRPRQVATLTASAADLLDTGIFHGIDPRAYTQYVTGVVQRITSAEFITDAGIRSTSLRHRDQLDHVAYQGPFTVWHKQTYDIAKGLRRHGFSRLAVELENRILNATNAAGKNNEYLYVDGRGRVALDSSNARARSRPDAIVATNDPDEGQAWTESAVLAIKRRRGRGEVEASSDDPLVRRLEVDILAHFPRVVVEKSRQRLAAAYHAAHAFVVDRVMGEWRQSGMVTYAQSQYGAPPGRGMGITG